MLFFLFAILLHTSREARILILFHPDLTLDRLVERYLCLCLLNIGDLLDCIEQDLHEVIPVGITLDERIADGYYYSGTVALVRELLEHPELMEMPADTPVEYAIRK